jgi:hypothetical protein
LLYTKKKTPQYRERDEEKREIYLETLKTYPEEKRVYLDETGICHKLNRTHGYSKRGDRIHGLTQGKRKGRTNIIGAYSCENGLFATQTYEHTVNKKVFTEWLKEKLVPHLRTCIHSF